MVLTLLMEMETEEETVALATVPRTIHGLYGMTELL